MQCTCIHSPTILVKRECLTIAPYVPVSVLAPVATSECKGIERERQRRGIFWHEPISIFLCVWPPHSTTSSGTNCRSPIFPIFYFFFPIFFFFLVLSCSCSIRELGPKPEHLESCDRCIP